MITPKVHAPTGCPPRGSYSLTEKAIQLAPLFAHMGAWGRRHMPVTHDLSVRAELLENGGPELWEELMDELRVLHLGAAPKRGRRSVMERLREAFEEAVQER